MDHLNFHKNLTDRQKVHKVDKVAAEFTSVNLSELQEIDPILSKETLEVHETTLDTNLVFIDNKNELQTLNEKEDLRIRLILEKEGNDFRIKIDFSSFFDIYFNYIAEYF